MTGGRTKRNGSLFFVRRGFFPVITGIQPIEGIPIRKKQGFMSRHRGALFVTPRHIPPDAVIKTQVG